MSYETAPATKMLASHCACCGRPLLDAVSVETGVGPECRKKHGFTSAQTEPDWDTVLRETDGVVAVAELGDIRAAEALWRLGGTETRRVANLIVHRIACLQASPEVCIPLTNAVRALGFANLAGRLELRFARVHVWEDRDDLVVKGPYSVAAVDHLRAVPGRRWDPQGKVNRYPRAARNALHHALRAAYPGAVALGPKGLFLL